MDSRGSRKTTDKSSSKRLKDATEAILPVKRLKKTPYFPMNNLTAPSKPTKQTASNPPITPIDINVVNNEVAPVSEIRNKLHSSPSKSQKGHELKFLQENSDDSFDGIRWKESPENTGSYVQINKNSVNLIPSSPLKNVNDLEIIDDRTADVLSRYGTDFSNTSISRTPKMNKSRSDITSTETKTKKSLIDVPLAQRAKSDKDLRTKKNNSTSLTDSFQNTLNTWMNRFETQPGDETNQEQESKRNSNENTANPSPNSEDPFSDDDDLIKALSQAKFQKALEESIKTSDSPAKVESDDDDDDKDSDDPFSEDDSELMEVLQTQTISTASKFAKSFQKGIENLEKLVIDKKSPSFEDTDDVAKLVYDRPMVRRYKIVNILKQEYGAKKDLQFILDVIDHKRETSKLVVRGEYCELELEKDDIIHIFITDPAHPKLVDNLRNLLIWNPDILLSATTIAQQIDCPRKTVVLSRYKFPGISSLPIIVGEMVHFIFQECICAENWTYDFMNKILDELLQQYLLAIFGIQKDKEDVKEEVEKHFPYLETWFKTYYKQPLSKKNVIEETSEKEGVMFAVEEALDIEEEIRSPVFGIKGKVDATVTAKFLNKNLQGKFMIPMEIKTGKEYIYHHAQASLYSLLFKDRYDMIIDSYLLVYTKEGTTKKCNIRVSDLRSLISLRNKVSQYIKDNFKLPPLVKNSSCDRCDVRTACMTLNHLTEFGTKEDCGIDEDEYETITRGIFNNDIYREYYQYWDKLIASEEDISNRAIKDLWTKNASERHGKCFDGMKIVESNDTITSNFLYAATHGDKSQQQQSFKYSFAKADARDSVNLLQSQFNVSDRVIISDEEGHYAITTGTIKYISRDKIVISARRRIITSDYKLKNYNRSNNQVFQSVLRPSQINSQKSGEKKFRIDKDEMFYGLGLARYNVLNLFLPHGATKIRKLVVDFEKPSYADKNPFPMEDQEKFNQDQVAAFEKIFTTKDYSLVLGMPGTGKTTVIAQIIKVLVQQDKSVLLTSYTNSAVDNILLKLKELGIDFLRIGHPQRVHKDIHTHIPGFREPITTYNQYVNTYMSPKVVATTCLGITDVCFSLRDSFDYCIVDEASQITLPINLGPLSFGKKFVLVGDHQQLPPLVLHPDQKVKQGLSQSLFKILAERHPQSVCELTYQYRMCKDIMEVSNILVYGNRLKCGSDEVAERSLTIPRIGVLDDLVINKNLPTEYRWMNDIFQKQNKVLFLDHDNLPALEETIGDMVRNPVEAKLTQQIVHALVSGGVTEDQIGIMSLYRSQVDLLRRTFGAKTNLEILTADQYQGRDKECIIISLVKSNERKNSGDLLKEWRRLNVAITRARSKLIILGSRSTLSSTDTTKTFIDFLENKGWYYMLPEDAHLMYNSPKVPTMTQSPIKTRKNTQESVLLNRRQVLKNVIQDITN